MKRHKSHRVAELAVLHVKTILVRAGATVTEVGGNADYGIDLHVQLPRDLRSFRKSWEMDSRYVHLQVKGRTGTNNVRVDETHMRSWRTSTVPSAVVILNSDDWTDESKPIDLQVCLPWDLLPPEEVIISNVVNDIIYVDAPEEKFKMNLKDRGRTVNEVVFVEMIDALSYFPKDSVEEVGEFVELDPASLVVQAALALRVADGKDVFSEIKDLIDDVSNCLKELVSDYDDDRDDWATSIVADTENLIWDRDEKGMAGPCDSSSGTANIGFETRTHAALVETMRGMRPSEEFAIEHDHDADKMAGLRYLTKLFARPGENWTWPMTNNDFAKYMSSRD